LIGFDAQARNVVSDQCATSFGNARAGVFGDLAANKYSVDLNPG